MLCTNIFSITFKILIFITICNGIMAMTDLRIFMKRGCTAAGLHVTGSWI